MLARAVQWMKENRYSSLAPSTSSKTSSNPSDPLAEVRADTALKDLLMQVFPSTMECRVFLKEQLEYPKLTALLPDPWACSRDTYCFQVVRQLRAGRRRGR